MNYRDLIKKIRDRDREELNSSKENNYIYEHYFVLILM